MRKMSTNNKFKKFSSLKSVSNLIKKSDLDTPVLNTFLKHISFYKWDGQKELSETELKKLTVQVQKDLGVAANGVITPGLVKLIEHTPRCGLPDFAMSDEPMAAKWGIKNLTYFVESYVSGLSRSDQDTIIQQAWDSWASVANLKFTRSNTSGSANFVISTGRGRASNFDGPNNTLAWAYLPSGNNYQGQLLMRFDLDETWVNDKSSRGIQMLNVAAHEFGHLLGLEHSRVNTALMAPYYSPNVPKPVQNDDVTRIVKLYGKPVSGPAEPAPTPTPVPTPVPGSIKVEIIVSSLDQITVGGKKLADFSLV